MSKMKYKLDIMPHEEVMKLGADLSINNDYITETAGFIPLEVKMKQFEQNGLISQFQVSDFDSNDYRDIYLNPDFQINPEDDLEDIQEKINARNEYMKNIQKSKSDGFNEKAGTDEPEKSSEKKSASPINDEKKE